MATLSTLRSGATEHIEGVMGFLASRLVTRAGLFDLAAEHFFVEQQTVADMTVKINDGYGFIPLSDNSFVHPIMLTGGDASVTITANSSGNSRIDAIIVYINRAASPNAACSNVATLAAIAGTPAASPVAPTDAEIATSIGASNPFIRLADVTVASGAASIADAVIKDRRKATIFSENIIPNADGIYRNAIMNSCFDIAQLGTAFTSASTPANSDDTYLLDGWNLFSDGNDAVDLSQEATEIPEGATYSLKLDVETAKRFGVVQFLEFKDAKKFKGKRVSISFAVKSANIAAIRAAILSWGSTADAITSDIVSSWAATPTWAANWTAENTPEDLAVTSSWTIVKIENIYIDSATVNNLALAIWLPNEETIGDIIYISKVQMNEGEYALDHQAAPFQKELARCQRLFWRFPYSEFGGLYTWFSVFLQRSTVLGQMCLQFPVNMRAIPTMASGGTFACSGATYTSMAVDANGMTTSKAAVNITNTGGTAGQANLLTSSNDTSTYISFDSRL